jgi:Flp pilus assembly protein TadB
MFIFFIVVAVVFIILASYIFYLRKIHRQDELKLIKKKYSFIVEFINDEYFIKTVGNFVILSVLFPALLVNEKDFSYVAAITSGVPAAAVLCYFLRKKKIVATKDDVLIQMPYALDIICLNLKVGRNLRQAIQVVAKNVEYPVNKIFNKLVMDEEVGIPLNKTLSYLCRKYEIKEIVFFAIILNNSYISGTCSIDSFSSLASAIRSQQLLNKKIKKNTAESRNNATIMIFIILAAFIYNYQKFIDLYDMPYGADTFHLAIGLGLITIFLLHYVSRVG